MIGILDYGAGNIRSVEKAVQRFAVDCRLVQRAEEMEECDGYILPGVGAFSQAMENLQPLIPGIQEQVVKQKKPLLGICLGLQLLYDVSYEDGEHRGLGLLRGEVVKFDGRYKVPHMGWNRLVVNREDAVVRGVQGHVYFVHSYYVQPVHWDEVVLYAEYGVKVPALVRKDNIVGMQFHPEKSSETGLRLLQNFLEMIS